MNNEKESRHHVFWPVLYQKLTNTTSTLTFQRYKNLQLSMTDQNRISPYTMKTMSSGQVMRIKNIVIYPH